jgi:predicted CxxxxCH...CXXCH cytochrome family protein
MKNHHEVGHFKSRMMIGLLSLSILLVMAGQSFAAMTCSSCHGMPPLDSAERSPTSGSFKGDHQKHMGATASPAECTKCHGNSGYTNDHAATSGYMIQMKSFINSTNNGTYSKAAPFAQTATPSFGNCSNVNCHFEKSGGSAPVWGTTTGMDCNSCHASQPATANHTKHLSSSVGGVAITCSKCHPDYGTTNFSHATSAGKHKIVVNTTMQYVGGTPTSWLPSQTPVWGACQNLSCHSNGKGTYINPTWGAAPAAGCTLCHPNLSAGHKNHVGTLQSEISFYVYTSNKSTAAGNKFGCANCHPLNVASHINETVDVTLTASASGGSLKAKNGAVTYSALQCGNIYCHSNGYTAGIVYTTTPVWGTSFVGDKCAACHGNSPNVGKAGSPAHTAHAVGIHYDDIFNGVSKKLPQGGGTAINAAHGKNSRSTTINCNMCHFSVVTAFANDLNGGCSGCHQASGNPAALFGNMSVANHTKHVNGSVDVNFINQKVATKAQVVDSAFSAYTAKPSGWQRRTNGMKFKTSTSHYDYTKSTLVAAASPYTTAAGCLNIACHSSVTVKWTDTITCNNCHTRLR